MSFREVFLISFVLYLGGWCSSSTPDKKSPPAESRTASVAAPDTMTWSPPRFEERQDERKRMVKIALREQGIRDSAVLEAMRHVPRHLFVPDNYRRQAYRNSPLPIGNGQTISQPYIVGYMTEMLDLDKNKKVLEIGTGSGYQAAVLSELTPHVYTIEIVRDLGLQARSRFKKLGYETIKTKIGDGYKGWEEHAPFDAVILTAAADEIPPPLIQQLKPGGVLVMPEGDAGEIQTLIRVTKDKDGSISRETLLPVRFVPMTGEAEGP